MTSMPFSTSVGYVKRYDIAYPAGKTYRLNYAPKYISHQESFIQITCCDDQVRAFDYPWGNLNYQAIPSYYVPEYVCGCPAAGKVEDEGVCVDSCPGGKAEDEGVCVECPAGKVEDGGVCVECPTERPLVDDNVCVDSCPATKIENADSECVCPATKIENADGVCVCPVSKFENADGVCICGTVEHAPFTNAEQNEIYYADPNDENGCKTITMAVVQNIRNAIGELSNCPL